MLRVPTALLAAFGSRTTADQMAARWKSDRRRDDLCTVAAE